MNKLQAMLNFEKQYIWPFFCSIVMSYHDG